MSEQRKPRELSAYLAGDTFKLQDEITETDSVKNIMPADDRTIREKLAEGETLSHYEKVEYIFEVVVKLEKLVDNLSPQVESLANGPMASMLGMLGGFGR